MDLTDSHAHLQESEFTEDLEATLARAREAGVARVIVPGVDPESSAEAVRLAGEHDGVFAAAGYHPHDAASWSIAGEQRIAELLTQPKVVAVGEIGLDFYRNHSPASDQERVLDRMLGLAEACAKPVIIHCREAWREAEPILSSWAQRARPVFGGRPLGVMHYFSASLGEAKMYAELGFMISIHTSVTHPKAEVAREVAANLALQCLLVETDSPYGAPQAFRGRRNEPSFLRESIKEIARLRGLTEDEVADATGVNAERLFGLPAKSGLREAAI